MALLLLAVAFLGLGVVTVTLLALTSWLSRPVHGAASMTSRRLVDGAVFGVCVLLAACVGAALALAFTVLTLLGLETRLDRSMSKAVALLAALVGAAGGAGWLGAFRSPPVAGAARGVGVLAFALVAGAGTALSPLTDAGPWRELAVVTSATLAAALAAAGLFGPPRGP